LAPTVAFVPGAKVQVPGWPCVHAHVEVTAFAQRPDQLGHVDPRSAVDRRGVLLAQDVDSHENSP
jgi:hypothetical protein